MPQKVQGVDDSTRLAERFGIVGRFGLLLDEVVVPVIDVSRLGELAPAERLCMGNLVVPVGLAGTHTKGQFNNEDLNRSTRVQLDRVVNNGPQPFFLARPTNGTAGYVNSIGVVTFADFSASGAPTVRLRGKNTGALEGEFIASVEVDQELELDIVILTFDTPLLLISANPNQFLSATFFWRESIHRR